MSKIPSAKDKDIALQLYYNRDIKGIQPPKEEDAPANFNAIESILFDDGYIEMGSNGLVLSSKGIAFINKGGYTSEKKKERRKEKLTLLAAVIGGIIAWLLTQLTS